VPIHKKNSIATRLVNLARRPAGDKWLLVKVYLLLGISRFAINVFSFPRLEKYLGARLTETPDNIADYQLQLANKMRWAISTASQCTPWNSNCFPQALTAKILLRRAGIPTTLYMGVAFKTGGSELQGHAWLRCGPLNVTGGDNNDEFGAVASFGE